MIRSSAQADAVHSLIDREDHAGRRALDALPGDAVDAVRGRQRQFVEAARLGEELADQATDILRESDAARREAADGIDVGPEDLETRQEGFGDRAPALPISVDGDLLGMPAERREELAHPLARMRRAIARRRPGEDGAAGDQPPPDVVAAETAGFAQIGEA